GVLKMTAQFTDISHRNDVCAKLLLKRKVPLHYLGARIVIRVRGQTGWETNLSRSQNLADVRRLNGRWTVLQLTDACGASDAAYDGGLAGEVHGHKRRIG